MRMRKLLSPDNSTNTTAQLLLLVSITPAQQQQQRQQHRGVTAGILPFLETDTITQEMETFTC